MYFAPLMTCNYWYHIFSCANVRLMLLLAVLWENATFTWQLPDLCRSLKPFPESTNWRNARSVQFRKRSTVSDGTKFRTKSTS